MPNLSTPTTQTKTAVFAEAANYGAATGQQISGNLYRGSSGKFTSGPTDAQLKDLGMERVTSDALLALMGKKEISPEQMTGLIQSGWAKKSGGGGKGKAEKPPKKSKDEITAENREKVKVDLETAGRR